MAKKIKTTQDSAYKGNTLIKSAQTVHQWTVQEVQEFVKCQNDALYFCEKYVKVIDVDRGEVPFIPRNYQREILKTFQDNRFAVVKCSRQTGKTVTAVAFLLWYCMFNQDKTVAILANKGATAREILSRFKYAFERIPKFLQQGVAEYNKGSIIFENGCKIIASATSNSAIRGQSLSCVYIDEVAFIPKNIWDEFYKSVYPTITSGTETKLLLTSTPNGLNHFYKIWKDSEAKRNSFARYSIDWRVVPGRDEKWAKQERENLGSERAFRQEHENAFLGSADTLIDLNTLQNLVWGNPMVENNLGYKQYESPIENHQYIMTVDTAHGLGQDHSAFLVIDVTERPYRVVATLYNKDISPLSYPDVIYHVCNYYNEAWLLVELAGGGDTVANVMYTTIEYPNLIPVISNGRKGQVASFTAQGRTNLGIATSKATKSMGCSVLKSLVEQQKLTFTDENLVNEMINFVAHKDSYRASEGEHDDLMMCAVNFAWLTVQPVFEDITNLSFKKLRQEITEKQTEMAEEEFVDFYVNDSDNDIESGEDYFF